MDKFDEKVIGYDSIKETLRQIADVLKRPEAYKEKGVSMPRGLLMESAPGLGKSLMASILMEESGRKSFVFRRINEGNTFLGEMKDIFDVAKEEAPSILLLEDLNLYVESNSPYAPEWACLQACIDETSDADIFVIATTNDTRYMPQSLLRPGRFDYILNLNPPLGKTAENIVSYYLRDKNLAKDVQISDIVKAMPQVSCATLETVMNLAAINSVYRDHSINPPTNFCMASSVLSRSISFGSSIGRSARTLIRSSFIVRLQIKTGQPTWTAPKKERGASEDTPLSE